MLKHLDLTIGSICTGGGLADVGAMQAGLTPIWGIELDPDIAAIAEANLNHKVYAQSCTETQWNKLDKPDVLWAIAAILLSIPNYGAGEWIKKCIRSYESGLFPWAVLLVRGDSGGVKELEGRYVSCEPDERIAFLNERGEVQGNPPPGYRFWYLGKDPHAFARAFQGIGVIRCPLVVSEAPRKVIDVGRAIALDDEIAALERQKRDIEALGYAPDNCWIESLQCHNRKPGVKQVVWKSRERIFHGKASKYIGMHGSKKHADAIAERDRRNQRNRVIKKLEKLYERKAKLDYQKPAVGAGRSRGSSGDRHALPHDHPATARGISEGDRPSRPF